MLKGDRRTTGKRPDDFGVVPGDAFDEMRCENDGDAYLVCVWLGDAVDAAIRAIPAQTEEHAHKNCAELPLGDRSPGTRVLGDLPACPDILGAAYIPMADSRRHRFRTVRDLARIERHAPPGKAMANQSRDKRRP